MPRKRTSSGHSSDLAGSEFFETLREMGRSWMERASAEAERGSKLSKDLSAAHSVADAVTACQEWWSKDIDPRAEDARQFHVRWTKAHGYQCSPCTECMALRDAFAPRTH